MPSLVTMHGSDVLLLLLLFSFYIIDGHSQVICFLFQIITWGTGMAYRYSEASHLAPSPNQTIGNVSTWIQIEHCQLCRLFLLFTSSSLSVSLSVCLSLSFSLCLCLSFSLSLSLSLSCLLSLAVQIFQKLWISNLLRCWLFVWLFEQLGFISNFQDSTIGKVSTCGEF